MLSSGASWHTTRAGSARASQILIYSVHLTSFVILILVVKFLYNLAIITFPYLFSTTLLLVPDDDDDDDDDNDDEVDDDDDDDGDDDNFYCKAIIEIILMARSADMLIVVA